MVSIHQSGNSSKEIPDYPDIVDAISENPARFLAADVLDVNGDDPEMSLAYARIRGIDTFEVLGRWHAVENDIGPRDLVKQWLYERGKELEEIGERPDRLEWPHGKPDHVDPETWTSSRKDEETVTLGSGAITTRTLTETRETDKSEQQALGAWGDE